MILFDQIIYFDDVLIDFVPWFSLTTNIEIQSFWRSEHENGTKSRHTTGDSHAARSATQ